MTTDKRFTASLNCRHRVTLTNVMGRAPVGGGTVTLTAQEDKDLRDMAGAVNQAAAAPGGCDSPSYPVEVQPAIPFGDYARRTYAASPVIIVAFPFTMPAAGVVHLAASEYQGQPWARLLTVSTTAGDLNAPIRSAGKVPDVYITAGVDFPPGTPLFANNILTEQPTSPGSSGSGFSIVWPPA